MARNKPAIVTFKVDSSLLEKLKGVRNRSEFIRAAILQALDSSCPLCGGAGVLTPRQMEHWEEFGHDHSIQECDDCHEVRIVCAKSDRDILHRKGKE